MTGPLVRGGQKWAPLPSRPFIREPEGLDLRHCTGFKPRQPHATRVHDLHAAHRQAATLGLGLGGHADKMRVQYESLIGLARSSTLSLQAWLRLAPSRFVSSDVRLDRTN